MTHISTHTLRLFEYQQKMRLLCPFLFLSLLVCTIYAQEEDASISGREKGSHKCPQDPSFSCNDDQTCCKLPKGEGVGCCPYKDATCCKDQTHCCPHGLTCDVKAGRCLGDSYNLLLARMVPRGQKSLNQINKSATRRQEAPVKLRKSCTDPLYSCDDSQTCCPLDEGGFGCCPLGGDAVCCPDKENCCPHGYVCDPSGGTCSPRPGRFWSHNL